MMATTLPADAMRTRVMTPSQQARYPAAFETALDTYFETRRPRLERVAREALTESVTTSPESATAPPPGRSTAERLEELQALRQKGLITEDEYQAKRRAILEGL